MHVMLRWLLAPFSLLWYLGSRLRNHLYDIGYKASIEFTVPTLSVGNLTVGGTGKTPMVEYLIRLLQHDYQVATLSRGYGRKTRGFRLAGPADDAASIGDEPLQMYRKFSPGTAVTVCEDRVYAIPCILTERPETNLVILDDAYQHRPLKASFSILLSDYNRPFYADWVLPAGRLREPRAGAQRADAVVITKCPTDLPVAEQEAITAAVQDYSRPDVPVFFAGLTYGELAPFGESRPERSKRRVVLVTGIAQTAPLLSYLQARYEVLEHLQFADHHAYTTRDAARMAARAQELEADLITTEKDAVKLRQAALQEQLRQVPCWYQPVEMCFLQHGPNFDSLIVNSLQKASETNS